MLSIALLSKMTARCGHKTARCGYETPVRERRNKGRVKSGLRAGRCLLFIDFIIAKANDGTDWVGKQKQRNGH